VEALFATATAQGEEGNYLAAATAAAMTTRTNLDLDQDVRREGGRERERLCYKWSLQEVFPYVEIGFRDSVRRTTTACGPNPFWNEELTMPFK
jgi:hypothetical protein